MKSTLHSIQQRKIFNSTNEKSQLVNWKKTKWASCNEAFQFVANTLKWRKEKSEHARNFLQYPWPKPSPRLPNQLPPRVMNVPQKEIKEFLKKVVSRYKKTLAFGWIKAAQFGFKNRDLEYVSDEEFNHYLNYTALSQFLTNQFDEDDYEVFQQFDINGEGWCKIDFTNTAVLEAIENCYAAPCRVLFKKNANQVFDVIAIELNRDIFTLSDQAWPLVKAFALQNAAIHATTFQHSLIHFPLDAINAITKSLKTSHIVYRLLVPHFYMQLPLDFAVNFVDRSVLHNDQKNIYTPFIHTKESVFKFLGVAYSGVEGKKCFPAYNFPLDPPDWISEYGRITKEMYTIIYQFVAKVVQSIDTKDEAIIWWADCIAAQIPGFPNGQTIFQNDNLVKVLSRIILNVSWIHSADHYSYSCLKITKLPLRLRVPPPKKGEAVDLNRRALFFEDIFRHYLGNEMYFKPHAIKKLIDVEYDFEVDTLSKERNSFINSIKKLYETTNANHYIPIHEIATSIQS